MTPQEIIEQLEIDTDNFNSLLKEKHFKLLKRENFASMAMSALIIKGNIDSSYIAEKSIEYADALINKLNEL
jgi:hypothetical protein